MYHVFARPFAQGVGSGWFWDGKGGWKAGVCGWSYRQALSLRDTDGAANMFIDNEFYSASDNSQYFYRLVGVGGIGHTAYAARYPNTDCSGAWVLFRTTVTPGVPGASPTGTFLVETVDGGGTGATSQNLTSDFFSWGVGRITLGLGASSVAEGYWDDVAFTATAPGQPTMNAPDVLSTSEIRWDFSPADNNFFGWYVADGSGAMAAPAYPNAGWLDRTQTSWTETGLTANTQYARKARAWNGTLDSAYSQTTATAWTLSVAPGASSVVPGSATVCAGDDVTWTAVGGFGAGAIEHYQHAWDQNPAYAFTGSEPRWSGSTLVLTAPAPGAWYLHVRGLNGAGVSHGTYDYAVLAEDCDALAPADFDRDGDVDQKDFGHFQMCVSGSSTPQDLPECQDAKLDGDNDVDLDDLGVFQACMSGPNLPADPACAE
jgi:hypothetical protein